MGLRAHNAVVRQHYGFLSRDDDADSHARAKPRTPDAAVINGGGGA
jgi:hypothetical protein